MASGSRTCWLRFLFSDGGREALQVHFRNVMKECGCQVSTLHVIYSENSLREHRKARSPSGQILDRSVS